LEDQEMTIKDFAGLLLLAVGIVGLFTGTGGTAHGYPFAWLLVLGGAAACLASYGLLRQPTQQQQSTEKKIEDLDSRCAHRPSGAP
jgi:hypothetical protein